MRARGLRRQRSKGRRRALGGLLLAAGLLGAASGCGSAPPPGVSLRIGTNPFSIAVLRDGRTVVAENVPTRLRFALRSSAAQYALTHVISSRGDHYLVATSEPGRTATVTLALDASRLRVSVALHPATGVEQVYDSFDARPNEQFLGGGERGGTVDLRGQVVSVKVSDVCSYAPVPFFASSEGWGLRIASENVSALAFPESQGGGGCRFGSEPQCSFPPLGELTEVCVKGAILVEDIYLGSIPQVLADYEHDAGEPRVPPRSELALIKWRGRAVFTGAEDLLADIGHFQSEGIPLGSVLLDDVWQQCLGTFAFDSRFPDPDALIREVHARGVRFMLWISPKVNCVPYPNSSLIGPSSNAVLDLRKASVVRSFEASLRRLLALGVDGFKVDRGDEVDLEGLSESLQNDYPLLLDRAVEAVMPKDDVAIFQAGTMGSEALVQGIWAGDQPEQFVGLERAIVSAATAAMSGFPTWGSDIGGYDAPPGVDADLFARWAQLGAISPVMEVGGSGENSTPWTLGTSAIDALRAAAILHYELFPYLYDLLERHQPVLAPLAYAYPDDAHAWSSPYELLVGPDLLAAPVTGPGTTPSVYLPPGEWVDLYTGEQVVGGGPSFIRPTPLTQFPLYARAGAVFPFNLRTRRDAWWGLNEQSRPGYAGYLATQGASLRLSGLPREVQLFIPASTPPLQVRIGGRLVEFSWEAGPFPGVVVHLHGPTLRGRIVLSG